MITNDNKSYEENLTIRMKRKASLNTSEGMNDFTMFFSLIIDSEIIHPTNKKLDVVKLTETNRGLLSNIFEMLLFGS
jgi:hypothetical protein